MKIILDNVHAFFVVIFLWREGKGYFKIRLKKYTYVIIFSKVLTSSTHCTQTNWTNKVFYDFSERKLCVFKLWNKVWRIMPLYISLEKISFHFNCKMNDMKKKCFCSFVNIRKVSSFMTRLCCPRSQTTSGSNELFLFVYLVRSFSSVASRIFRNLSIKHPIWHKNTKKTWK